MAPRRPASLRGSPLTRPAAPFLRAPPFLKSASMTRWTGRLGGPTGSVLALRSSRSVRSLTLRRRRTTASPWLPSLRQWRPFPLPPKSQVRQPRGALPGCGGSPRRTLASTRWRQAPRRRAGGRCPSEPSRRAAAVGQAGAAGQAGARGEAAGLGVGEAVAAVLAVALEVAEAAASATAAFATSASQAGFGSGTSLAGGIGMWPPRPRTWIKPSRMVSSRQLPRPGHALCAPGARGCIRSPSPVSTRLRGSWLHTCVVIVGACLFLPQRR